MHFGWTSKRGLNKENRVVSQLFFYALILHSTLRLDSVYGIKKPEPNDSGFPCSGDRTRTCDLRVMSPTSSQLLHPAMYLSLLYFNLFSGYSPDELLRRGGLHPAMYLSLLYFNLFSGYSPDELLRRGGLQPAMYLSLLYFNFAQFVNRGQQR